MTTTAKTRAVLFDRDDTLIENVPYNGDPATVVPMPTVRAALDRLRDDGVLIGVVTNQSGVSRGLITTEQVDAVNARVDELLGPFDAWAVCPHGAADGCECRKPLPGLIMQAAAELGVSPSDTAVIGDIGSDMAAAQAAGARGILVPTAVTLADEISAAPDVAGTVAEAVALLFPEAGEQ